MRAPRRALSPVQSRGILFLMGHETDPAERSTAPRDGSKPHLDKAPGRTLGKYVLESQLGKGGAGIVYRARDTDLGRVVALKVLLGGGLRTTDLERFKREARILAGLRHANTVPLLEFGEADGILYYTMELVEGEDLAHLLERGPLPVHRAFEILREAAKGVAHAHSKGVIHRDLKPGNVLVDGSGRVLVTDFGLAKRWDSDSAETATGAVLGTPAYMAPEQAAGENRRVDERSDVYGLGAVLYHMLARRMPFDGANVFEILCDVIDREPLPPRAFDPSIPIDAEVICLKALEKDPAGRYATVAAMLADIERFLDGDPIAARPVSRVTRWWRKIRKRPLLFGAACAVALLSIIVVALVFRSARIRSDQIAADLAAVRDLQERGALDDALTRVDALLQREPGHAEAVALAEPLRERLGKLRQLQAQLRSLRRDKALATVNQIIALNPKDPYAHVVRGKIYNDLELFDMAFDAFETATRLDPKDATAWYLKSLHWLRLGDLDRSIADIQRVTALAPESWMGPYHHGELLIAREQYAEAVAVLAEVARRFPQLAEVHSALGRALVRSGRREEGKKAYRRAIDIGPVNAWPWVDLAAMADGQERVNIATEGLERFETDRELLLNRADGYKTLGRFDRAEEDLLVAGRLHPKHADVQAQLGRLRMTQGRTFDARVYAEKALAMNERCAGAHHVLANLDYAAGRRDAAISHMKRASELEPANALILTELGGMLYISRDLEGAFAALERALKIRPTLYDAWWNYGWVLYDLNRYDPAYDAFLRARDIDPKAPLPHSRLGYIRERQGRPREAVPHYDTAIELGHAESRYFRARAFVNNGEYGRARPELEWVVKNLPAHRAEAEEILSKLPK